MTKHIKDLHLPISRETGISLLFVGAILGVVGGALIPIGRDAREKAIKTLHGELIPFNVDMSKPFTVMLSADVEFSYGRVDLANGFDLNDIFPFKLNLTTDQFKIEFIDNRISVSANIKNSENVTIAQIVNNEWKTVNPDTLLFWDRNYNAYAFEIIGSNNVPTLQVIMVGPNAIQLGGLFYTQTGRIYIQPMETGAVMWKNPTDQQLEDANILTIFRYPALTNPDNLGKLINPIYPSSDPLTKSTWIIVSGFVLAPLGTILFAFGFHIYKSSEKKTDKERKRKIGQPKRYYRSRKRKRR